MIPHPMVNVIASESKLFIAVWALGDGIISILYPELLTSEELTAVTSFHPTASMRWSTFVVIHPKRGVIRIIVTISRMHIIVVSTITPVHRRCFL